MPVAANSLIAVDIGNSRLKLGRFANRGDRSAPLPLPAESIDLPIHNATGEFDTAILVAWCDENVRGETQWLVASVHRGAADRVTAVVAEWAKRSRVVCPMRRVTYQDVPLAIRVNEPARIGIDRLLAALAADRLRQQDRAAIIVDLGTAITIDLLEADGAFAGGAILPGIAMSARALAEQTDALPLVAIDRLETRPPALGKSTIAAIQAGLYWGALGAVRELISQLSSRLPAPPELFLTGGSAQQMTELLSLNIGRPVRHVPHLVLSGIALVKT